MIAACPEARTAAAPGRKRSVPPPARSARLAIYSVYTAIVLAMAFARLLTGAWYETSDPFSTRLIDGWPASWEARYYLVHFRTFLGNAPPALGIAPVHYRSLFSLFLATSFYAALGSAYWSMALVELLSWVLAAVATYHIARRLGAGPLPSALSGVLVAGSPLFVGTMWAQVFHVSEFASLAFGLWAALALAEQERSAVRLCLGFGALLYALSLTYQYQWTLVPVLLVLTLSHPQITRWAALLVVGGAVALYGAATLVTKAALATAGLAPTEAYSNVVSDPSSLVADRLAAVHTIQDLRFLLPSAEGLVRLAAPYHPLVFLVGVAGILLLPRRGLAIGVVMIAVSLAANTLYNAPWTAMSAYPLVYVGASAGCCRLGSAVASWLEAKGWSGAPFRVERVGVVVSCALVAVLVALTNLDLVGQPAFLLQWWSAYAERALF